MTNNQKHAPGTAISKESRPCPGKPWVGDVLGSEEVADELTNAVKDAARADVNNAYVIGLHGEWGTGKTFMLERWCEELKLKEKSPCVTVYYNAWEDDFLANPLIAIIARLQKTMDEMDEFHSTMDKFSPILKAVNKIARVYIGNVDVVKIMDVVKIILEAKGDVDKSGDTDEVNRYLDLRKETDILKENLRSIAKVVKKKTKFPLVFVIDELDRCRPVFALEVLERVKHLFNVPGIVFVLGMNKAGLKKSIGTVYGYDDAQSEEYLRRFFDREVSMPLSSPEIYCDYLLKTNGVSDYVGQELSIIKNAHSIKRFFVPMTGFWELTLREVEGLVRLLLDFLNKEKRIKSARADLAWLIVCLMFLKGKNPALYSRVIEGKFKCNDLIDEMMEMFCDKKDANPKYHEYFWFCQNTVEEEIYRLADESEWENIKEQMEMIKNSKKPYPDCPALAKRTMELGENRAELLYGLYEGDSDEDLSERVPVQVITSLIELNDVK